MRDFTGYVHGINLGGWLSQCDYSEDRYNSFITEKDFEVVKNWGLDHVRIPVDYNLVEDAEGNYKEEGFARLQKAIDWCRKYGLHMILDLHKTFGFSFDIGENETGFFENEEYQERFYRLWEEFAKRYGMNTDMLCFELLNEVTDKAYCDTWNRVSTTCIKRIRAFAPDMRIIIGGYYNNSIEGLKDIAEPVDDKVVYTFHCYEPLIFTHQGAHWVDGMNTSFRMPFESTYKQYAENSASNFGSWQSLEVSNLAGFDPEKQLGIEYFEKLVEEAIRVAEERNVPLYCGEYGVINFATPEDTMKWYRQICACFDKHHIARAAWIYKEMDFGIADAYLDSVRDEVLKCI